MSTTEITVTGNVVTSPSRVRTQNGSSVTNFRVASTERRYDSASQGFVDGASFFVDVECWNELGGNVSHSISKGDPVIVRGTLRTHEWESDAGRRSRTQLRAQAVGFDLSRGTAEFRKTQRAGAPVAAGAIDPGADPGLDPGLDTGLDTTVGTDAADRDYDGPVEPLYELDPETSAAARALEHGLGALPEPALH